MSAGLFPIVPTIGGQSEFVPKQFQYRSLNGAVKIVSISKLDTLTGEMAKESNKMSNIAKNFSETNYKKTILVDCWSIVRQSNLIINTI